MIKTININDIKTDEILKRKSESFHVEDKVKDILSAVKEKGDEALREFTLAFDKADLASFAVTKDEIAEAIANVDPSFLQILENAAENIRAFHEHQKRNSFIISEKEGIIIGQKVMPLEKVGIYVPGGTAAYPSTVLMDAIPAKIAGCRQIVMVSPPDKNGKISDVILAAAKIAGIDQIYKIGGAQAVAALAYGTDSIPKVDKIVGPGNAYVAEAKKQVYGLVGIDMIAGPSEILVIADEDNDAKIVAADLLSQAEHDKNASAILITTSKDLADKVTIEIEVQLETLPRKQIASASIDNNGLILIADSITQAIDTANAIAPEHLELCVKDPFDYLDRIKNAGSLFLGKNAPEALGDYFAGPNHTLPTSGTARFSSPLSVDDFSKKMQYTYYSKNALAKVADDIARFAKEEGLDAHGRSVLVRKEDL